MKKGFQLEQFQDVFTRIIFLSPPPKISITKLQFNTGTDLSGFSMGNKDVNVTDKNHGKALPVKECNFVTHKKGGMRGESREKHGTQTKKRLTKNR